MLGSDRVLSRRQERFDMKNKGRPSRIDIRADNRRFGPSQRLKGAVYMVEPGSLRTLANGEVREYYLSIGICMPFSLAILLAAVYPASACLTIPIPGSAVNTRSSLAAASGVPSATRHIPA